MNAEYAKIGALILTYIGLVGVILTGIAMAVDTYLAIAEEYGKQVANYSALFACSVVTITGVMIYQLYDE